MATSRNLLFKKGKILPKIQYFYVILTYII